VLSQADTLKLPRRSPQNCSFNALKLFKSHQNIQVPRHFQGISLVLSGKSQCAWAQDIMSFEALETFVNNLVIPKVCHSLELVICWFFVPGAPSECQTQKYMKKVANLGRGPKMVGWNENCSIFGTWRWETGSLCHFHYSQTIPNDSTWTVQNWRCQALPPHDHTHFPLLQGRTNDCSLCSCLRPFPVVPY